jgi:predicted anti-sigma-YlaC factor YlaD
MSRLLHLSLALGLLTTGCIKKFAINKLGDALAGTGTTFSSDDDPDLVADAIPFGLKLYESLLAETPRHKGLLLAAATGFTQYSYAFVDQPADEAMTEHLDQSNALRARARRLYLRAHRYGLRGLEVSYPGLGAALEQDPAAALARTRKQDIPLLYWTAASHGLAISASKSDPEMIAQLPVVEAILRRVTELDESWGDGAVPQFRITIESVQTGLKPAEKQEHMRKYFERSLQLSKGVLAAPFVSYAENACVANQNRAEFKALLEKALAIDADAHPSDRLANLVAQRRARWLLSRIDELFLEETPEKP